MKKIRENIRLDFRQIAETSPDAILVLDLRGNIIYGNQVLKKILGYTNQKLKNANIKDILTTSSNKIAQKKIRQKIRNKKPSKPYLLTAYDSKGREKLVEVHSTPLIIDGQTQAIQVIARDVSQEHETKSKLKSISEHLGTVLDGIDESIVVIREDYKIVSHNKAFRRHVKGGERNYEGRKCFEVIHGYSRPCRKCIVRDMFKTGKIQEDVHSHETNEEKIWHHTKAYPLSPKEKSIKQAIYVFEDISKSKNAEERLTYSEQKYRTTINSMRDGIHVVNEDLSILLANKALREWNKKLGLTQNTVGKKIKQVYPFLGKSVEEEYRRVFESGKMLVTEEENNIRGLRFVTETRKIPVLEDQKISRVVTVIRDITQRKNAEASLIKYTKSLSQAYRKLETLNENKTQFISIASHELKTPISIMKGYADVLNLEGVGKLNPKQKEVVTKISEKSMHLADMVDVMLDLSKIELGEFKLDKKRANLSRLANQVLEDFKYPAARKNIKLTKRISGNVFRKIDEPRIKQVLTNLLDNAIKYTPEGGRVNLSLTEKKNQLVFRVCDTGIGISKKDVEEVFKPFSIVDGSRTRNQGGAGLGLAIVKQITHLHGGQVKIISRSKGTCFEVKLP